MFPRTPFLTRFLVKVGQKWNFHKVEKLEVKQQSYYLKLIVARSQERQTQRSQNILPCSSFPCSVQLSLLTICSLQPQVDQQTKRKSLPLTSPPAGPALHIIFSHKLPCVHLRWQCLRRARLGLLSDLPVPVADPYFPSFCHNCVRSHFHNTPYSILFLVVLSPWLKPNWQKHYGKVKQGRGRGRGSAGGWWAAILNNIIREVLTKKETLEPRPEAIKKIIVKSFLKHMKAIERIIRIIKDLAQKHIQLYIL